MHLEFFLPACVTCSCPWLQGRSLSPAVDMDSLREAISQAAPGKGEVRRAIVNSTFQPRAAAFTSLIQQCARAKSWQKAIEVFEAMQETSNVKVRRCQTYLFTYSATEGLTCRSSYSSTLLNTGDIILRAAACLSISSGPFLILDLCHQVLSAVKFTPHMMHAGKFHHLLCPDQRVLELWAVARGREHLLANAGGFTERSRVLPKHHHLQLAYHCL